MLEVLVDVPQLELSAVCPGACNIPVSARSPSIPASELLSGCTNSPWVETILLSHNVLDFL